tara:strand:- start:12 stop:1610 length:1599 start_codon:yes stop_codon:yes gene_type:complete
LIKKIKIRNFAIIDDLVINFDSSFNVITGDTGSGKSLIIKALDVLFGGKISSKMIRDNSKEVEICAIMEGDIDLRFINKNGRSFYFINSIKSTKSHFLDKFKSYIQFQRQHDSNDLLNESKHLYILDTYALNKDIVVKIQKAYFDYIENKDKYQNLLKNIDNYRDRYELYKYQIEELDSIDLNEEKEDTLSKEYRRMTQSNSVRKIFNDFIKQNNSSDYSINLKISKFIKELRLYEGTDEKIKDIVERLEDVLLNVDSIIDDASIIESQYYFSSDDLLSLEDDILKYEEIKRKYGGSIKAAIDYKKQLKSKYDSQMTFDDNLDLLKKQMLDTENSFLKLAKEVSDIRLSSSKKMSDKINFYLKDMGMPDARIKIKLSKTDIYRDKGLDDCKIYVITNKGEEYKPLSQIASGGEISRIMLAINLVFQKGKNINTLVFDEVDSGISGAIASNVGDMLRRLSDSKQLVIVTHLPQIASKSTAHFLSYKKENKGRVISLSRKLEDDEHELEIARMLSGKTISRHSISQAREIIANG